MHAATLPRHPVVLCLVGQGEILFKRSPRTDSYLGFSSVCWVGGRESRIGPRIGPGMYVYIYEYIHTHIYIIYIYIYIYIYINVAICTNMKIGRASC